MKDTETIIFTDGSSRGNPGPGGWAAVIVRLAAEAAHSSVIELGGRESVTTNNRMELAAVCEALDVTASDDCAVLVLTDSAYVLNGASKWVHGWKRAGWKTSTKADVANRDLWERYADAADGRIVRWQKVAGHADIPGNERCDEIATTFADNAPTTLYEGPLSGYTLTIVTNGKPIVSQQDSNSGVSLSGATKAKKKTPAGPAYSYVSSVDGVVQTHRTWEDCKKRVHGVARTRFKKSFSAADEAAIIAEWKDK